MKIRIIGYNGGGMHYDGGGNGLQKKDNANANKAETDMKSYSGIVKALKAKGITVNTPRNDKEYHKLEQQYFPDKIIEDTKSGRIPLNNAQRKLLGTTATKWADLTTDQQAKLDDKTLVSSYGDLPGFRGTNVSDAAAKYMQTDAFKALPQSEKDAYISQAGSQFSLNDKGIGTKTPYQKQNLPFYQITPELSGFVSALNTYNYQTPDYQHWEQQPNKLNIQPQLQSIDSSLNAVNQTTTGSPQIDNIRKVGAFTQALAAKQQAYSNKQNYDAEKEFQATANNINARTQEQNLDITAQNDIFNNKMALAADYASGERIAAISSGVTKYALNAQNENEKALRLQRGNYSVDGNGNIIYDVGTGSSFDYQLYGTDGTKSTTPTAPNGNIIPPTVDPNSYTPGATDVPNNYKPVNTPPVLPTNGMTQQQQERLDRKYGPNLWKEALLHQLHEYGGMTPVRKRRK